MSPFYFQQVGSPSSGPLSERSTLTTQASNTEFTLHSSLCLPTMSNQSSNPMILTFLIFLNSILFSPSFMLLLYVGLPYLWFGPLQCPFVSLTLAFHLSISENRSKIDIFLINILHHSQDKVQSLYSKLRPPVLSLSA